jgi:tripartite-type tricarboxylate transporter receptor subunit TctC
MRKEPVALSLSALLFLYDAPTHAQTYPTRVIRLVVPFGPGGPTDVAARVAAQALQADLAGC